MTPIFITEVLGLVTYIPTAVLNTVKVKVTAHTALAYFYLVGFYDTHQC